MELNLVLIRADSILQAEQLGFNQLNDEERQEMIVYDSTGDIHVKAICEDCHESLQRNPDCMKMIILFIKREELWTNPKHFSVCLCLL